MPERTAEPGDTQPNLPVHDAGRWTLDPASVQIAFRARGLWGLVPVSGRFTEASGELVWRPAGTAAVRLDIDAASVDTGVAFRDRHLRSPEFLDTEHFATIAFIGDAERVGGALRVTGHLTIRGTRTSEFLDVQLESSGHAYAGSASTALELASYGIRPRLGLVRPTVRLTLRGRLVPEGAAGPIAGV